MPAIAGIDHPKVIPYPELLSGAREAGDSVAIIGAGGIGFDVATFLTHRARTATISRSGASIARWSSAVVCCRSGRVASPRQVYLLQRKAGKPGAGLGKTTGWIHRTALKHRGVVMRNGVCLSAHRRRGLAHRDRGGTGAAGGRTRDHLRGAGVGQRRSPPSSPGSGKPVHVIGGALLAAELDAERAIREGVTLAARL